MVRQAVKERPVEACGILAGRAGVVEDAIAMTNVDHSSEHFMMDPKEQFRVVKELRAKELAVVAVYHSHPASPARPSAEDIRLALTPDISYVIVSLAETEPVVRSFRIADGMVEQEELALV
jgi:proteasome lid subunit RPN8/RPN11